jgi:NAD(P)-dependent dehydrogenase (short-subunit alcohol dehydrogenase family)
VAEAQLNNRVALVTGGASGIGRASALALASAGAVIALADIDESGAHAALEEIVALGGRGIVIRADATEEAEVAAMIERIVAELGGLDIG